MHFGVLVLPRGYQHQSEYKSDLNVTSYSKVEAAGGCSFFVSNQHLLLFKTGYAVVSHSVILNDAQKTLEELFSCSRCGNCSHRTCGLPDIERCELDRFFRADQVFRHDGADFQLSLPNEVPQSMENDFYTAACQHVKDLVYHCTTQELRTDADYHPTGSSLQKHLHLRSALRSEVVKKIANGILHMPDQIARHIEVASPKLSLYAFPNSAVWTSGVLWGVIHARPKAGYCIPRENHLDVDFNTMTLFCTNCGYSKTCTHVAYNRSVCPGKISKGETIIQPQQSRSKVSRWTLRAICTAGLSIINCYSLF
jgi:transcription elongation factor Elf1